MKTLKALFSGAAPLGEGLLKAVAARLKNVGATECQFPQGDYFSCVICHNPHDARLGIDGNQPVLHYARS